MPDIPASTATTAVVTLGGAYANIIEVESDHDWIRVSLTAGQTYEVTVRGTGPNILEDTKMELYDAGGNFLAQNDDYGGTFFSGLIWTAETTGNYYIDVSGYDSSIGNYTVSLATAVQPAPLETLDWGTKVADNNVTFYFVPSGQTQDGITSEGFNAYEMSRFEAAFDMIEAVSGLTFTKVNSAAAADFKLVLDTNENNGDYLGYFNPPGETNAGVGVFAGQSWDRTAGGSLEFGGYDFVTITHEILHGLGLAHPHDNGGTSTVMEGVTTEYDDFGAFDLNQGIFTTMSYNTGFLTGGPGTQGDNNNQYGYEFGPMALDIAVLQAKYGANTTTNTGNTVYALAQSNADGTGWRAIWDAGGIDEIRQTGAGACSIDLREARLATAIGGGGFISAVNGIAGGVTIAAGVVIENATGGNGGDKLVGNAAANILNGGAGADTMNGQTGNDTYFVDNAADVLVEASNWGTLDKVSASTSYVLAAGVYVEQLKTTSSTSTVAINLTGNAIAQSIFGNAGANTLSDGGGAGDTLTGSVGNDIYVVRAADTLIAEGVGQGTADRVSAGISFALASGDYVEQMNTTSSSSTAAINLTGNSLVQSITGNAGSNTLHDGGGAGADTLTGMAGNDTYRIYNAGTKIVEISGQGTADKVATAVSFTLAAANNIEVMTTNGSAGTLAINLTGNSIAQSIYGNAGANRIDGKAGSDRLSGGNGADTFVFSTTIGSTNIDTLLDFSASADQIEIDDAIFAGLSLGVLAASAFVANMTGNAEDDQHRIIYNATSGGLYFDADGTGSAARVLFALLSTGLSVLETDFTVV